MEGRVVLMKQQAETPTFYVDAEDDKQGNDKVYATTIKEANYQKVTINTVIEQQHHLNPGQKEQLRSTL